MRQGDIVTLRFPFTNLQDSKIRPALIISNEKFNQRKNLILIGIYGTDVADFSEKLVNEDLEEGRLQKESFVRFQNVFTLQKDLVLQKVARINQNKLGKILEKLNSFF